MISKLPLTRIENEIVSIGSLLGVILREQRDIVDSVDDII